MLVSLHDVDHLEPLDRTGIMSAFSLHWVVAIDSSMGTPGSHPRVTASCKQPVIASVAAASRNAPRRMCLLDESRERLAHLNDVGR
jgi:hypothetical protein